MESGYFQYLNNPHKNTFDILKEGGGGGLVENGAQMSFF